VTNFWLAGAALIIVALVMILLPLVRQNTSNKFTVVGLLIVFPALVVLLYQLTTTQDWEAQNDPAMVSGMPPVEDMVAALEQRLQTEGGSLDEWLMLGRSLVNLKRFPDALVAYQKAWELSDQSSTEAALGIAETLVYLDKTSLQGEAGQLVEWVLEREPENPRALWFGGLVSLAAGKQAEAASRWTTLLKYDMPPELRSVIQQQLAALPPVEGGDRAAPADSGVQVSVTVDISDELREKAANAKALYVFVRDSNAAGGPPLAVQRLAPQLPAQLVITDANVMMPGATLSGKTSLSVTARLSMSGDPIAAEGDLSGAAVWQGDGAQTRLIIESLVVK